MLGVNRVFWACLFLISVINFSCGTEENSTPSVESLSDQLNDHRQDLDKLAEFCFDVGWFDGVDSSGRFRVDSSVSGNQVELRDGDLAKIPDMLSIVGVESMSCQRVMLDGKLVTVAQFYTMTSGISVSGRAFGFSKYDNGSAPRYYGEGSSLVPLNSSCAVGCWYFFIGN